MKSFGLFVVLCLSASSLWAQWRPLGPDYNPGNGIGRIECIAFDPAFDGQHIQTLYVGSPTGGLWKSLNAGKSWSNSDVSTDALNYPGVAAIAINPLNSQIIYIAQGTRYLDYFPFQLKIYKSLNGGKNWQEASSGISFPLDSVQAISKIIIHPKQPDILFAATSNGVYKSLNAGKSWKQILKGNYHGLEFYPSNANILYASGFMPVFPFDATIMKSVNAGDSWESIADNKVFFSLSNQMVDIAVCKAPGAENNLYALLANKDESSVNDFFISTDAGKTWTVKSLPYTSNKWQETSLCVSPDNPQEVFVGKGNDFYKMSNVLEKNPSWEAYSLKCYGHAGIHAIGFAPITKEIFVASDGGLQNASTCRDLNNGLSIANVMGLADAQKNPATMLAGTMDAGSMIFEGLIKDRKKWRYLGHQNAGEQIINRNTVNLMISSSAFLGTTPHADPILCTKDHWLSRFSLPNPVDQGAVLADYSGPIVQDYEAKNSYFFGFNNVYKATIDYAKETVLWSQKSKFPTRYGVDANSTISSIALSPQNNKLILVALHAGRIFKSLLGGDGGTSTETCITGCWSEITPLKDLSKSTSASIAVNPVNENMVMIAYVGRDKNIKENTRIMKSDDRINFTPYAEGLPNVSVNKIVFLGDHHASALVATDAGVFYRNEEMNAWKAYADSLPNVAVKDLEINSTMNIVRIATLGRGVWEAPLPFGSKDQTTIIDRDITWNKGMRLDGDLRILKGRNLHIASMLSIANGAKIYVEPQASLILDQGGVITNNENWGNAWEGNILIEENASFICHEETAVRLRGKAGITVKSGDMPGNFIFNSAAKFFLQDEDTFIKIKGNKQSLDGGKLSITGKGKVY